jgi:hypothetical protein
MVDHLSLSGFISEASYGQSSSQSLKVEVLMTRMHKVKHSQALAPKSLLLWPIDFTLNHIFAPALFSMASLTSSSAFTANEIMFFSRSPPLPVSSSVESVGPCSLATASATYPLGRIYSERRGFFIGGIESTYGVRFFVLPPVGPAVPLYGETSQINHTRYLPQAPQLRLCLPH